MSNHAVPLRCAHSWRCHSHQNYLLNEHKTGWHEDRYMNTATAALPKRKSVLQLSKVLECFPWCKFDKNGFLTSIAPTDIAYAQFSRRGYRGRKRRQTTPSYIGPSSRYCTCISVRRNTGYCDCDRIAFSHQLPSYREERHPPTLRSCNPRFLLSAILPDNFQCDNIDLSGVAPEYICGLCGCPTHVPPVIPNFQRSEIEIEGTSP